MRHPDLPPAIVAKAYVSPGAREFAWRRPDVVEATTAYSSANYALLGGEVWWVTSLDVNWTGLIPSVDGGPDGVWTWDTEAQREQESWEDYCQRTALESIDIVGRMKVEEKTAATARDQLWFNLTWTLRA
jgi:hypothetical protein